MSTPKPRVCKLKNNKNKILNPDKNGQGSHRELLPYDNNE